MENNRNAKIMGGLVLVGVIVGAYFLFKKGGLDGMEPQQAEYYKGKAIIKNNDGSFTVKHGPNKPSTTHKSLVKAKRRIDFNKSKVESLQKWQKLIPSKTEKSKLAVPRMKPMN